MKRNTRATYEAPAIEIVLPESESLMVTASPGVGGEYNEGDDIDAKGVLFDEDSWPKPYDVWE